MKVIILSSGKGIRMMPLTENTPKPMLEVNGQSLLQNKINLCKDAGLTEINIKKPPLVFLVLAKVGS